MNQNIVEKRFKWSRIVSVIKKKKKQKASETFATNDIELIPKI